MLASAAHVNGHQQRREAAEVTLSKRTWYAWSVASDWFAAGATLCGAGVALGAFGAHGLRARLSPEMLAIFETGVRYHLIHALGLLAVAWAASRWPGWSVSAAGWLLMAGTVVFSGSLYVLAVTGARWLGAVTPIGGLCLIAGWTLLALAALRAPS